MPIPVKESVEEPAAKINVLLQAYISQLKLEDKPYSSLLLASSEAKMFLSILCAIFEICLKHGWAVLAKEALHLCKMVEK